MTDDFASWACDSTRTREELYGAQLLIEQTLPKWRTKHEIKHESNFEADQLRKKERQLNPAYQPGFAVRDAERVAEILVEVTDLRFDGFSDRPMRDLTMIQFCPQLKQLSLTGNEATDLSPLRALPRLESLTLYNRKVEDLRPIASVTTLRTLLLNIDCPWPKVDGFEALEALTDFTFAGNILVLRGIPRLAAVRHTKIDQTRDFHVPLPSVAELPEMPELRTLYLENTWKLDGLERYPRLLNLTVFGYHPDLAPLASLREATSLFLSGGTYESLAPISAMTALRHLTIRREEPQDYTPLAAMPHLHEITVELCPSSKMEIATIHAGLTPWADDFGVHPPRPLQPLRLRIYTENKDVEPPASAQPRDWGEDKAMRKAEARWFAREVNRALRRLLGAEWGRINVRFASHPGHEIVKITRPEDIDRALEIVTALRRILAAARHPWLILLVFSATDRYEVEMDELSEAPEDDDDLASPYDEEEFDPEEKRQDWEYQEEKKRERREFLERQYRFRLQQEQGLEVDPQEFAPQLPEPEEKTAAGGVTGPEHEFDLGTDLTLYADLTETIAHVWDKDRGLAEMLLEMKGEEPEKAEPPTG